MCLLPLHQELPTGNSGSLWLLLAALGSFLVPALGMCTGEQQTAVSQGHVRVLGLALSARWN